MDVGVETDQRMQRVRIGLTGLGFVFILVLLATALAPRPTEEAPLSQNMIAQQNAGTAAGGNEAGAAEPQEPLAQLGVAPGNAETNNSNNAAGAPAVQPRP
jgi:hypothetical protein